MTRYVVQAVPWRLTIVATGIVVGLMTLVARWPAVMWPLQGTALGLIAGITAWAADEPAAQVVDTLPRPLWWRITARAAVVPLALGTWIACLLAARSRLPDHFWFFVLQAAGMVGLALAVTTWRRGRGVAEPGRPFAAIVVPTATAVALARPFTRQLPVFPVWPSEDWHTSRVVWVAVTAGSFAILAAALIRSLRKA
ncbi:hypothetical protein [Dactylosporangium sp. NPDC048998]|uniref:hypothetical protein n=1 Tax=Dactylosporangium sp. NPDC048998 TaxID=3363976 RepID=UPI0037125B07